ncbi:PGRS repeat-containing protein [Mycolicibacter icosiumassiliensis]|uniref:PGRS repeat-containing protein n=1 Tax=Mycolicibacter icosiumassiliensis TaxID=1792835 RepID=UPI00082E4E27|nr:hypothetical protein [Mycolicibacter icosiumassiliensis]
MSHRHTSSQRARQSAAGRGGGKRVIGATSTVGAFLAFGMAPLGAAPSARADELDLILDPAIDWLSNVDPAMGAEVTAWVGAFDPTFAGDSATAVDSVLDSANAGAAASVNMAQVFDQWIYTPIHTSLEAWINSSFGEQVDNAINQIAGLYLIGDGTAGTAADPDGGAGGLWFGDGGSGYDASADAGVAGGAGGAGGLIGGNGAAGGTGTPPGGTGAAGAAGQPG